MPNKRQDKYYTSLFEDIVKLAHDGIEKNKIIEEMKITNEMLLKIFDGIDEVIYITDLKNYKILYANKKAKEIIGNKIDRPCHEALQNLYAPCDFCRNTQIKEYYKVVKWIHTNRINGKKYKVFDMRIPWKNGHETDAKFEIAIELK